jgi:glycosyltransferase involved in cell wall biosynthesis
MSSGHASARPEPWIMICGGFHTRGGMDRANLELAERLVEKGHPVYLVGHDISAAFTGCPGAETILVPRPAGSIVLGESRLARRGREIELQVKRERPDAIVVANGGNGISPDINWVHYVHHASRFEDSGGPLSLRLKNRCAERVFRRHEKQAIGSAKLVIANSELTRQHVVELLGAEPERVETIYLGANSDWAPPTPAEKRAARTWLNISEDAPVIAFVGALGHDQRKGFSTLWEAWKNLTADPNWTAHLVVAGGGHQVNRWRKLAAQLSPRIHILGFTDRVRDLLAASDLLVSPVHYEPFGLNVTEAVCRGVPAMVSAKAGVAEVYPPELRSYLLSHPQDHQQLAQMLRRWSGEIGKARAEFTGFSEQLRQRSWRQMADEFIALAHTRLGVESVGNTLVAAQ